MCSEPLQIDEDENRWTIGSKKYAYPGETFFETEEKVRKTYTVDVARATAIAEAYGLTHAIMISEMMDIAKGGLREKLENNSALEWEVGAKISSYFSEDFTDSYPLLAESLSLNFSSVTVTSTAVECAFSLANNQVHANNSATTNADKMQHAMSVRGGICRELRSKGAASSRPVNPDTTPKRTYRVHRSARSSHAYFRKILDFREEKLENVPTVTNQSLRVHCKTEKDFELTLGYTISELQSNEGNVTINADSLAREIRGFNKSKFEGSYDMPMSPD